MRGRGSHTHSPDEVGRHPLGIDHGLLGRDIPVQVLFVDTPEGAPVGAECRPTPVAGMTVDLAYAITISFPRPRPSAVAHGGVGGRAAVIALPLRRGLALGHPAPPPHKRGRPLPGRLEDGPCQPRVVGLAGPTAGGRKVPWRTAQAPLGAAALGAYEAVAILVAPQPEGADAVIQAFGDGNVNHAPMIPHPARWLHMSRDSFY